MKWAVPKMWEGKTVAILASGPSMSQAVADRVRAARIPTIVINTTVKLAPWADVLYAADAGWWSVYKEAAQAFKGLKVTCDDAAPVHELPELLVLKESGRVGFDPDPAYLRTGGNGGYQAIHLAVHAGASRILLCGYDMRFVNNQVHWHGRHANPLRDAGEGIFPQWLDWYATLVEALELREEKVEVLNCTPGSALRGWPKVELEEALAGVAA